ncbi:MAG: polar amino acid transport system permease protein [Micromonosporaceae bacterium]|jgi:polar amino acid transport system permease protein|nr:polar amino acid transport system permease protein [Micromonosporaceae bacterium]
MILNLLIGLPDQRPGGLALSVLSAVTAGGCAVVVGILYATACAGAPRLTLVLQGALALLRGIPLLLLIFVLGQFTSLPLPATGFAALALYSLAHVGETLRAYLTTYPQAPRDQARVMAISPVREWLILRIPWTLRRSLDALGTHWISLLKDTGALTVLGIGELTTVARLLSERTGSTQWMVILVTAAALYLVTVVALIRILALAKTRLAGYGM